MSDQVRVVDTAPAPNVVDGRARRVAPVWPGFAIVVAVGLLLGYLAAALGAVPPRVTDVPVTVDGVALDPDRLSEVPTVQVTTSISSEPAGEEATPSGTRLQALVPGFSRSVTWTTADGRAFKWRSTAVVAERLELPEDAGDVHWSERGVRHAYVAGRNDVLYVAVSQPTPVAIGVASFAWNSADFNEIAWLDRVDDRGAQRLFVSSLLGDDVVELGVLQTPFGFSLVAREVLVHVDAGTAVLETLAPDVDPTTERQHLVLIGRDGAERRIEGVTVDSVRRDGAVVVAAGDPSTRLIVPLDDAEPWTITGVPEDATTGLVWSPDGASYAVLARYGLAWLGTADSTQRVIRGELDRIAWSGDGRFIVGVDRIDRLVFHDLETAETTLVDLNMDVAALEAH